MKPEKLIEVLSVAERLKDAVRHCYTSGGRRESVAEHSWRITLMAYFVSDEFPDADLLKNFKNIGATIHAHPMYCMVFVAQTKPIPNITEATMKRGPVECIPYTQAYTKNLHEEVYKYFDARRELAEKYPIGAIMPLHGVVVSGSDLFMAYSMLERIEADAICNIFKNNIKDI